MKRLLSLTGILLLTACSASVTDVEMDSDSQSSSSAIVLEEVSSRSSISSISSISSKSSQSPSTIVPESTATELPKNVELDVPFASQAPKGDWGDPYQEACEEASLILVKHFLEGTGMNADLMDAEILELVAWETQNGYGQDVTVSELATIAQQFYGLSTEVIEGADVTIDRIKRELAAGNPVILPVAGREIGNPYFSGEGPWYHMLVVTGYDSKNFITNDVGTRHGEDYEYRYNVLFSAIHDWTGVKEETRNGPKRMLIVKKG